MYLLGKQGKQGNKTGGRRQDSRAAHPEGRGSRPNFVKEGKNCKSEPSPRVHNIVLRGSRETSADDDPVACPAFSL